MLDNLIIAVNDAGLERVVYYIFHVLGFIGVFIFAFWARKKYRLDEKIKPIKYASLVAVLFVCMYIWMIILYTAVTHKLTGSFNTVRGVVWLPLVALPFTKLYKVNWRTICGILAPCLCLVQGIGHIGCIFTGCCESRYEWAHGIYNVILRTKLFPIQLVESLICFIIVGILVYISKRTKFSSAGYMYPLMMVLFGSTRFICEFIRYNMITIFGINPLGYHALIMTIVGIIWLIVYGRKKKKNPALTEETVDEPLKAVADSEIKPSKTAVKNKSAAKNKSKKKKKA